MVSAFGSLLGRWLRRCGIVGSGSGVCCIRRGNRGGVGVGRGGRGCRLLIGGGSRRRFVRRGMVGSGIGCWCISRWCRGLAFQQVLLTRALGLVSASSFGFSSSLRVGAGVVPRMGAGVPPTVGPLSTTFSTGSGTSVKDQPRRMSDGIWRPLSVRGVTWTKPAASSSCNRRRAVS